MRTLSFLVVASVLSSLFIGMALVSVVLTDAVHAQLPFKSLPLSVLQN
jgi:hypothetical protein